MHLHTLFLASVVSLVCAAKPVTVGYYADWTSAHLPPQSIPYAKLTHLNYAFAVQDTNGTFTLPTASLLKQVVSLAKPHKTKVLLSVGGWTGSRYFSTLMASAEKRTWMRDQLVHMMSTYHLDGIDFDWEFPGRVGMSCNVVNEAHDSDNFLKFLKDFKKARSHLTKKTELTMAVRIAPFDKGSHPLADVSAFAAVTDRINIMAYDLYGAWSPVTGPNAPFKNPSDAATSAAGAVKAWHAAKWPLNKMALGVPFYGRAVTTKDNVSAADKAKALAGQKVSVNMVGKPIVSTVPKGDGDDAPWAEPCPGSPSTLSGIWKWSKLRTGPLKSKKGWIRGWDKASQTPWLYNVNDKSFVSYDDTKSIGIKAAWAVCQSKLGGVMIWDLSQDYQNELLNAIHKAIQC